MTGRRTGRLALTCYAYLRLPYETDPGDTAPVVEPLASRMNREVRRTVIKVVATHLQNGATEVMAASALGLPGVVFDRGVHINNSGALYLAAVHTHRALRQQEKCILLVRLGPNTKMRRRAKLSAGQDHTDDAKAVARLFARNGQVRLALASAGCRLQLT
jgi:hypothetical protein